jgi:hypothetical protein
MEKEIGRFEVKEEIVEVIELESDDLGEFEALAMCGKASPWFRVGDAVASNLGRPAINPGLSNVATRTVR